MTDAEKAYERAKERIAEAKAEGATELLFERDDLRALAALPPEIADLSGLRFLDLGETQVSDLTPLAGLSGLMALWLRPMPVSDLTPLIGLSGLQGLWLNNTSVSDLTPLSGLSELTDLWLNDTPVRDLRPVRLLRRLVESPGTLGLTFTNCLAAKEDPLIAEISEIEDNAERARVLFAYLADWEPPGEAARQGGADASPLPPQPRLAPLQADIQGGRLIRAGGKGLPKADPLVRAEAGWRALKAYRETFGSAFNLHNHHPLGAFLDAFDQAMGDRFDPESSILIGAMGGGIVALAGDGEFCGQLPAGAEPLLRQFAAQVQTYLNRFPDWTAYQQDAAGSEDNTASAAESFEALDEDLQASPDTDRDVAEIYDMQVRAALDPQSAEGTRKGLVASTGEVTRALAEKALDEVRSGQAVRGYVGSMDKVHDAEAAKVGWYAGGFSVVFIQRRKAHFRRLADAYPSRMGWLHGVLDYLFGAERD